MSAPQIGDALAPPPPTPKRTRGARTIIGSLVAAAAIGIASFGSIASASAGSDVRSSLTIIAPAAAGGGWDTVAREMQ